MKPFALRCRTGQHSLELSTQAFTAVTAFRTLLSAERNSASGRSKYRSLRDDGDEKQRETNEAMQSNWESVRLRERDERKEKEWVKVMMTIHHCRYSHCIKGWHEWLPPRTRPQHPLWLLQPWIMVVAPAAPQATPASEMAMDKSDLPPGLRVYITNPSARVRWGSLRDGEMLMRNHGFNDHDSNFMRLMRGAVGGIGRESQS